MPVDLAAAALEYLEAGWPVFPVEVVSKEPLIPTWGPYQRRLPTVDEVERWWQKWPDAGIGLVTGKLSGVVVVDLDLYKWQGDPEEVRAFARKVFGPSPWVGTTQRGGEHWYYLTPPEGGVRNHAKRLHPAIDLRGEGGYVVVAPTPGYTLVRSCDQDELPVFRGGGEDGGSGDWDKLMAEPAKIEPIEEGARNDHAARLAGHYIAMGINGQETLDILRNWNCGNKPPLPDAELKAVVKSILQTHKRNHPEVVALQEAGEPPVPVFARTKDGGIKGTLGNVVLGLEDARFTDGWKVGLDTFLSTLGVWKGKAAWAAMIDADQAQLRHRLEKRGFAGISKLNMEEGLAVVGKHAAFDSAQDWLETVEWDGVPRVETFLVRGMGAEDRPYARAVSRYLWTALAGRIVEPAVQADAAPIFVGEQGCGKTSAVRLLAPWPETYTELSFHMSEVELCLATRGVLVAEISELRGLHTRDLESVKAFMSRRVDKYRVPYARFPVRGPRRFVCIGTTNADAFLGDPTGNRRWLPVRVGEVASIDLVWIQTWRDQLWAEGRARFLAGGVDWEEAVHLAVEEHAQYEIEDVWTEEILAYAREQGGVVNVRGALKWAIQMDEERMTKMHEMRVSAILKKHHFKSRRRMVNGKNLQFWESATISEFAENDLF